MVPSGNDICWVKLLRYLTLPRKRVPFILNKADTILLVSGKFPIEGTHFRDIFTRINVKSDFSKKSKKYPNFTFNFRNKHIYLLLRKNAWYHISEKKATLAPSLMSIFPSRVILCAG